MNFDDERPNTENEDEGEGESGSDELLSDDSLRLPEGANILVRVHAVRAWLSRRYDDATLEVGRAALALQEAIRPQLQSQLQAEMRPLRRREQQHLHDQTERARQLLSAAQLRLATYEEAQVLLEECITHASGERVLVEYYLALEDLVLSIAEAIQAGDDSQRPRLQALADVQHRVERVGTPHEDDE